ncbi:MAG: hypothetical protein IT428_23065 [Planctomycetaceae bacterium]|nr:hypothetical protein [Planctomycetaceae bacterium]
MSRLLGMAITAFAALAIQPALNEGQQAAPVMVSLPILVAALGMFVCGPAEGVLWAALAGLISDALHAPPLGVDMFCLTLMAFAVRRLGGGTLPRWIPFATLATGALTFCTLLMAAATRGLWMRTPLVGGPLLALAVRGAVGNMLVAAVGMMLWRMLPQRLTAQRPRRALSAGR